MRTIWQCIIIGLGFALAGRLNAAEDLATNDLPTVEVVLKRAIEQAKTEDANSQAFKQGYFYTRTKVTEYRDGKGELKKREEKTKAHVPKVVIAPKATPVKTISFDGGDDKKEVSATQSNVKGKAFDKNEFLMNDDLLSRFDFVIKGRTEINERPVLVLDFKPKKGDLPENSIKDKFINKAAGRVWLDETEASLVKADLRLTERVNVVGGLVGAVWKFTCQITRGRTDEGVWFTSATSWHLEGREVFVRKVMDYREESTDVRKAQ